MDEQLRSLERRSAEGRPEDEVAHLRAALRAGRLDPRRVRAAAYLGHGPSRVAVGDEAPAGDDWLDREGWVRVAYHAASEATLLLAGRLTQLRGGGAGCYKRPHEYEGPCGEVLEAARAWLLAPGPATAQAARERESVASRPLDVTMRPTQDNPLGNPPEYEAFAACSLVVVAISAPESEAPEFKARRLARAARAAASAATHDLAATHLLYAFGLLHPHTFPFFARRSVLHSHRALRRVLGLEDPAARGALRDAVIRGVVPWLLGRADPVRAPG